MRRKAVGLGLAAAFSIVFASILFVVHSYNTISAQQKRIPTRYQKVFDLRAELPPQYREDVVSVCGFRWRNSRLYYWIKFLDRATGRLKEKVILVTDEDGRRLSMAALSEYATKVWDVDSSGDLLVVRGGPDRGEWAVERYDPEGHPVEAQAIRSLPVAMCVATGRLLGLDRSGEIYEVLGPPGKRRSLIEAQVSGKDIRSWWPILEPMPNGGYLLVEGIKSRIHIGGDIEGPVISFAPSQPEVLSALEMHRGQAERAASKGFSARPVTLYRAVCDPEGTILVAVAGHRLDGGSVILEYDGSGEHKGTGRYVLPPIQRPRNEAAKTQRYLFPSEIAASSTHLFILNSEGTVVKYPRIEY